jgi:hypothetical protein
LKPLSRRHFQVTQELLEDLDCIAHYSRCLAIKNDLGKSYLDAIASEGVFQHQADLFTRIRQIAKQIGYSREQRYKSLGDLCQLFADSGIPPVARLIKAQLESLLIETEGLELCLPQLHPSSIPTLILHRETLRNDSDLFEPQRSSSIDEGQELSELSKYQEWIESQLDDPYQSEDERTQVEALLSSVQTEIQNMKRPRHPVKKSWQFDPKNSFSLGAEQGSPHLHLTSQIHGGSYKNAAINIDLTTLEDQLTVEDRKSSRRTAEGRVGSCAYELGIYSQLRELGVRHLPQIYSHEELDDGRVRIHMEHFRGRDAAQRLQDDFNEGFDWESLLVIGRQLLEHLADLHEAGYLHRDIKPSNILLKDADGKDGERRISAAAVTDFGLTTRLAEGMDHATPGGGTPPYRAPELIRTKKASKQTDIWAAGATLFECKFGRRLLRENESAAHVWGYPTTPTTLRQLSQFYARRAYGDRGWSTYLDDIDRLILMSLWPNPKDRFSAKQALLEWERIERDT